MSEVQRVVLVVDDTPTNIRLLNGMLSKQYKVKAATNGEKALQIARTEPQPDIILLDVMMPGIDGYEVCRLLKADPLTSPIPVIFITAKNETEDEQQGFALGAADYIIKPFNPSIVEARVSTHLAIYDESRKLRNENQELKEQASGGFREFSESGLSSILQSGESDRVEFKSTLRWNLHTDKADKKIENACLKTVAAFLNSDTGTLLIGVDDEGTVLGMEKDRFANEDKALLHWNSLLKAHLGVEFMPLIQSRFYSVSGKRILAVQCLRSSKPVFFRRENEESFFARTGNGTHQLKPSEVLAYIDHHSTKEA